MKLDWLSARWREKEDDFFVEGVSEDTPNVFVRARGNVNVAARLSEDIALALGYVAQYGDFHRAALAYAKEYGKWNSLSSTALADAAAETPTDNSEIAALRAEVRRLNELVGFFERSNTARLLGISESQLAAVRGSLGHIRQRWTTVRGAGDGSTQDEVRRAVFGPWYEAIERWVEEGCPLAP